MIIKLLKIMIIKICTKANFEYIRYVYVYVKSLQCCPVLCDPVDYNPPGSSVHGILQVGTLEWVVISFSRGLPDPGKGSNLHLLHWQVGFCH